MSSKLFLALRLFAIPTLGVIYLAARSDSAPAASLVFPIGCEVFALVVASVLFWLRSDPSRTARWQAWADAKAEAKKAQRAGR